jgi:antitoxin (DNA-binding transcriptional repressor) of toxin-antitoxin stability system
MKSISSADANRHFSAVLRDVSAGEEVVVVSRGKPVGESCIVETPSRATRERRAQLDTQ